MDGLDEDERFGSDGHEEDSDDDGGDEAMEEDDEQGEVEADALDDDWFDVDDDDDEDVGAFDDGEDEEDDDDGSDAASIWAEDEEMEDSQDAAQQAIMVCGLETANRVLSGNHGTASISRTELLSFHVRHLRMGPILGNARNEQDVREDGPATALLFDRFVTLLESGSVGLRPILRNLTIVGYPFDLQYSFPTQDVDRMFGPAFRSLPVLRKLAFEHCALPARCLGLLCSPSTGPLQLVQLELEECKIDSEGVKHVASLVRRQNSPLRTLTVTSRDGGGLEPADCQVLCESVPHSTSLRSLGICVREVRVDTLSGVAASTSPLRALYVMGTFTEEGVESLTRQLRTNTRMTDVRLSETDIDTDGDVFVQPLLRLLETYNFTLRRVRVAHAEDGESLEAESFAALLRRNRSIRHAIRRLKPQEYRVSPTGVWPLAFEKMGAFPTLLYRLVRRGNVDALCEQNEVTVELTLRW